MVCTAAQGGARWCKVVRGGVVQGGAGRENTVPCMPVLDL